MYHSITIGDRNTWGHWHLYPESRPLVVPPKRKTNYVNVPGMNGTLDFSEVLTGYPTYEMREGSWTFYVENGYGDWATRYTQIMNYLQQGKKYRVVFEDDPDYYYEGYLSVNQWQSVKDYSKITIDYKLFPYKYWVELSTETFYLPPGDWSDPWVVAGISRSKLGLMPVTPEASINNSGHSDIEVHFTNNELGIDSTVTIAQSTRHVAFPSFVMTKLNNEVVNHLELRQFSTYDGIEVEFIWRNGDF